MTNHEEWFKTSKFNPYRWFGYKWYRSGWVDSIHFDWKRRYYTDGQRVKLIFEEAYKPPVFRNKFGTPTTKFINSDSATYLATTGGSGGSTTTVYTVSNPHSMREAVY